MRLALPLSLPSLLLCAAMASAQTVTYDIELRGEQEAPPVTTSGIGTASITLDPATGVVQVTGSYRNTSGTVVAAHIHGASRRGANSGVLLGLQVSGGTTGTISGQGTLTAAQVQDLQAGLTYVNVHSQANPGGELRGQIDVVPGTGTGASAPSASIDGPATGGGTLNVGCPPGLGSFFLLVGLPSPGIPLAGPFVCSVPTVVALDLGVEIVALNGASHSLTIPAALSTATVGLQCGQLDFNNACIVLAAGHHVRITP